jgi:hypothetical protein
MLKIKKFKRKSGKPGKEGKLRFFIEKWLFTRQ